MAPDRDPGHPAEAQALPRRRVTMRGITFFLSLREQGTLDCPCGTFTAVAMLAGVPTVQPIDDVPGRGGADRGKGRAGQ